MKFSNLLLFFLILTPLSVSGEALTHVHGQRSHHHQFPEIGVMHRHGNGDVGSMLNTVTQKNARSTQQSSSRSSGRDIISLIKVSKWEGIGTQTDGSTWKVIVYYQDGKFYTSYPSLSCAGELRYLPAISSSTKAAFTEVILSGKTRCASGLRTEIVRLNDDLLNFLVIAGKAKISLFNNGSFDSGGFASLNPNNKKIAQAKLVRSDRKRSSNDSGWIIDKKIMLGAIGDAFKMPNNRGMLLELSTNNKRSSGDKSLIKVYKRHDLRISFLKEYKFSVNIEDIYGGSDGHPVAAGTSSSGIAGVYACFLDANLSSIGCLAWTDHTNKFAFASKLIDRSLMGDNFYATSLKPLMKRLGTISRNKHTKKFSLRLDLLEELRSKLPSVHSNRSRIKVIEYGAFVGEASSSGKCYKCEAEIHFKDVSLR